MNTKDFTIFNEDFNYINCIPSYIFQIIKTICCVYQRQDTNLV